MYTVKCSVHCTASTLEICWIWGREGGITNTEDCMHLLHCIALHFTELHCTTLHCTALHCTALHCTALHCTALHCTALHCTALHCVPHHSNGGHYCWLHTMYNLANSDANLVQYSHSSHCAMCTVQCSALYFCTVQQRAVIYTIVRFSTVLYNNVQCSTVNAFALLRFVH